MISYFGGRLGVLTVLLFVFQKVASELGVSLIQDKTEGLPTSSEHFT